MDAIKECISREGRPPSYPELAAELGKSLSICHQQVKVLRERGYAEVDGEYRNTTIGLCKCPPANKIRSALAASSAEESYEWPTCPHCGVIHTSDMDDTSVFCDGCGNKFKCERIVTYETTKD